MLLVGSDRRLLDRLREVGYRTGERLEMTMFERRADRYVVLEPAASGIALWRTSYTYRSRPVWLGRLSHDGARGVVQVDRLRDSLVRSRATRQTAVGPKGTPTSKRRVLVVVLREPPSIGAGRRSDHAP